MITLRPTEKIHLLKRRHRFVLITGLFPLVLISLTTIILMIILCFVSLPTLPDWLADFAPTLLRLNLRYLLLFSLTLFLQVLWLLIFLVITYYYLDCWIVTNERTIHAELKGLFSRTLSSINHDRIQDISIDVHGFFPTMLRFGDLYIQTAGEFREFVFRQIPDPYQTKKIIFKAQKEFLKKMKKNGVF